MCGNAVGVRQRTTGRRYSITIDGDHRTDAVDSEHPHRGCDVTFTVTAPAATTFLWMEYERTAYRWPVRAPI
jgi:hypothetical protein